MIFYTYEQLVCGALAVYKDSITVSEIFDLMSELESANPEMHIRIAPVTYSSDFITYDDNVLRLKDEFDFDAVGEYDGHDITLRGYLALISGVEIVTFLASIKEDMSR